LISSELARRGHHVTLLTFDSPRALDFYTVGAEVERMRIGVGNTLKRSGPITTAARLIRVRQLMRDLKPDVAVGFMHSAFVPLSLALLGTGVPVIGSERTSFAHYRTRLIERLLLRATCSLLSGITVNGEDVRRGFPRRLAARMVVLPNPVMKAKSFADPVGSGVKTLLSVGGLRPEKDHRTLLIAFARIAEDFPDWNLRIVGDGPLKDRLVAQATELGLGNRVELAGASGSVEAEYHSAQLFVLPSIYEAFPNCVAEALAHGLPAVGFADCPGTNALILPGVNGALATGENRTKALCKCLAQLMESPVLRQSLGKAAPSTMERFSLSAVADQWERLLQGAVRAP
jgi:glycosyltransferase involved in cell wall biosynthesis